MKKTYIGVKTIKAEPSVRIGANGGMDGYEVEYPDGYVSWSPKEQFERAYFRLDSEQNSITQSDVDRFAGGIRTTQFDEKTAISVCDTVTGFCQYETSSCVDPNNFDLEIGRSINEERIKNRIWTYLGFVLQWADKGIK